ncbi:MAG TPA: UDP-N-acetylmuramate dehydrogenase [Gammaproteobacteria bacterium]|nr:UDP-N-acetylmuramate dehydrogenase [Gammaproteobacteria bacterium]
MSVADDFSLTRAGSLQRLNTFRVAARAEWLAEVRDAADVPRVLARPELRDLPCLALGGGSNVLFVHDVPGLVLRLANRGIAIVDEDREAGLIRVAAGENWNRFVRWSLEAGFEGLENLILIPGSVGAAPIQNIGAYGVEAREFIAGVEAWDREAQARARFDNAACEFGYRDSIFKHRPNRYIVTGVDFRLPRRGPLRLDYAGVRQELESTGVQQPTAADVARAVEALRRRKLPDPAQIGNAGSFFKNPVVSQAELAILRERYPDMPAHAYGDDQFKLSAAWLIDACGLKGARAGAAGVSDRHALVLVNHGGATGEELWALATRVRETVAERFGVTLEPEPVVI